MPDPIPALLPTTVIGSYSLPRWLEHAGEGLRFTRRAVAYAKLRAMTAGAALARAELGRG